MVATTENSGYVTSLSENLAKTTSAHITPLSPEKYIQTERIEYSLEELIEKTEEQLAEIGITNQDILDTIGSGETFISRPEKRLVETETAMEWAANYWKALNQNFENRLKKSTDKSKVMYADVRMRALGVTRFLDSLSDYTNGETYAEVRDLLTTACDIYILAEATDQNLNIKPADMSRAISRSVNLGLRNPQGLDQAISMVTNSGIENVGLYDAAEGYIDGIKAEFMAAKIMGEYEYGDIGYTITFKKPLPHRDSKEGTDFCLTISDDNKNSAELAIFDVKKAAYVSREGCCRLVPENGGLVVYEGNDQVPSRREQFVIPESFEASVLRLNEVGIVIRLPKKLIETSSIMEIDEMDNGSNTDYNTAKSQIFNEVWYVFERMNHEN